MYTICELLNPNPTTDLSLISIRDHERFINYYGQHNGRFSSDQRIHESREYPRSRVFWILNILLFWAPEKQLEELSNITVDHLVNYDHRWKAFMNNTKQDWSNYVVAVSVIVSAVEHQ